MKVKLAFAAALAAAVFGLGQAQAAEMIYTETMTTSGSLGGVAFTNALVTLSGEADTSDIYSLAPGASDLDVPLSVTVQGLGTAHFVDDMIVFSSPDPIVSSQDIIIVGFSDITLKKGLLSVVLKDVSYDLQTPFGPFTGPDGVALTAFATDQGGFSYSPPQSATFQATLAAVPEPSTWLMMIGGLSMLGTALRRRRTLATA
jgi:hypothetical protein